MKFEFKDLLPQKKTAWAGFILTATLAFTMGTMFRGTESGQPNLTEKALVETTTWTCSMHPSIQQPHAGDCPICGMDLIPLVKNSTEDENFQGLVLSAKARKLAGVEVAPAIQARTSILYGFSS